MPRKGVRAHQAQALAIERLLLEEYRRAISPLVADVPQEPRTLHAVLDVKHSQAWNSEVLMPLVEQHPRRAKAIAEGAVLRLWCGKRCFDRYRREFGLARQAERAH